MGEALSKARLAREAAPVVAAAGSETRSEAIRRCVTAKPKSWPPTGKTSSEPAGTA